MATPFVAGTAALILSKQPTWTPAQVQADIEGTAHDVGEPGKDNEWGAGLLDGYAAVAQAAGCAGTARFPTLTEGSRAGRGERDLHDHVHPRRRRSRRRRSPRRSRLDGTGECQSRPRSPTGASLYGSTPTSTRDLLGPSGATLTQSARVAPGTTVSRAGRRRSVDADASRARTRSDPPRSPAARRLVRDRPVHRPDRSPAAPRPRRRPPRRRRLPPRRPSRPSPSTSPSVSASPSVSISPSSPRRRRLPGLALSPSPTPHRRRRPLRPRPRPCTWVTWTTSPCGSRPAGRRRSGSWWWTRRVTRCRGPS